MSAETDEFLAHFGIMGMHWGVRKKEASQPRPLKYRRPNPRFSPPPSSDKDHQFTKAELHARYDEVKELVKTQPTADVSVYARNPDGTRESRQMMPVKGFVEKFDPRFLDSKDLYSIHITDYVHKSDSQRYPRLTKVHYDIIHKLGEFKG